MSNLDVCVGPEFTTGPLGELRTNGTRPLAWPYNCGITTENALCVDPTLGMWVKPYNPHVIYNKFTVTTPNPLPAAPSTTWFTGTAYNFVNTSQCAQMSANFVMTTTVSALVSNASSWLEQWGGWYVTNPGPTPTTYTMYNSWNSSIASTAWRQTATDTGFVTVSPGATLTLYYAVGLRNQSSAGTITPSGIIISISGTTMAL